MKRYIFAVALLLLCSKAHASDYAMSFPAGTPLEVSVPTDNGTVINSSVTGGNNNSILYVNETGKLSNNANFTYNEISGRMGIGTASPAFKLDVIGTGNFSDTLYTKDQSADGVYANLKNMSAVATATVVGNQTVTGINTPSVLNVNSTAGFPISGVCTINTNRGEFSYTSINATAFLGVRWVAIQSGNPLTYDRIILDGYIVMQAGFSCVHPTDTWINNAYQSAFLVNTINGPFRIRSGGRVDVPGLIYGQGIRLVGASFNDISAANNYLALNYTHTFINGYDVIYGTGKKDVDTVIGGLTDADLLHADASTDRIGIGTATPNAKLDVNLASGVYPLNVSTASDNYVYHKTSNGNGNNYLYFLNTADNFGNWSIGREHPGYFSIVSEAGAAFTIYNGTNNVGINTITPAYKLDVAGDIQTNESIYQNTTVQVFSGSKALTDNSATGFVDIAIGSGEYLGGDIEYSIYVTNATDMQAHSGDVAFCAINSGGSVTSSIVESYLPASEAEVVTAGTLTDDWTITNGAGKITINVDADSSLDTPTLTLKYTIILHSYNNITAL